ncbi:MAG: dTDP-4-dehydrorhamnose reductase [Pseudomonadota bacterium]
MSILVFGKTGQVATELTRLIPDARYVGRDEVDLAKPSELTAFLKTNKAQVIINAAAYTAVDKAEGDRAVAMAVNGASVGTMAEHAAAQGIPFLHISTDYVFAGNGTAPWRPDDPTGPLGIYGKSKLAGEALILNAGGTAAILRTSWVFSAHGNNFVKTMLRLSETRDHLTIVADQIGGPTPAHAIAAALLTMARAMAAGQGGGTYHFAGEPQTSWADFAREIFRLAGRDVTVEDILTSAYPTPAARPLNSRLDCSSIRADFGITPPDWRAELKTVITELGHGQGT